MENKSNMFKNTLILVVITFVAVAALAVVNQITEAPIEQAEINQKAKAYKVVYADAQKFDEIDGLDKMIENSESLFDGNGLSACTVSDALAVKNSNDEIEGYVISSTSSNGYGGEIQVAVGIKDNKLTGFTVISNNETPGLGSKCTDSDFQNQFKNKTAQVLSYTKSGASSDTEIDAISGATITTSAVTEAVNAAIVFYQSNFGTGASVDTSSVDLQQN